MKIFRNKELALDSTVFSGIPDLGGLRNSRFCLRIVYHKVTSPMGLTIPRLRNPRDPSPSSGQAVAHPPPGGLSPERRAHFRP